jgi:glycosyltransferase involved in cell wall biosynthesis
MNNYIKAFKMHNPLVSIIITTFNKTLFAIETLKSVLNQTHQEWECIVVDDGSTINDFNILQEFINIDKRFTLNKRPKQANKGANACRNYGMLLRKDKYIQFFDSDNIILHIM